MRWRDTLLASLLALQGAWGKSDEPSIEATKFKKPGGLFYFDDSDVVILTDVGAGTAYRSDDAGVKWQALSGVKEEEVLMSFKHPYDNKVAIALGRGKTHWITKDQGKSWKEWSCEDAPNTVRQGTPTLSFHASDPDRILFMGASCDGLFQCKETVYYTTDGFDSKPKELPNEPLSCLWAKSSDLFTTGDSKRDENEILCTVKGSFNPFEQSYRLLVSSDYFKTTHEPTMNDGRTVPGIINLAAVKHYIVAAAKSEHTKELALYVTTDAKNWHRAEFGEHKLEQDAYTVLESTNYSMQVDVLTTHAMDAMGALLTSNSNGTYFSKNVEHTNRSPQGFVDFEKIQNIQGIVMVNVVDNYEEVVARREDKKIKSKISFDDGRTFHSLKVDDDELHLHSVTEAHNQGRVFSSPAPGIVMGVGNTGKYLDEWSEGDLYISDDAGLTWKRTRKQPHFYEFGDQGAIIIAIEDAPTKEIHWSINHGEDWDSVELEDEIRPRDLTTVPDSTSLKFLLTATRGRSDDLAFYLYSLDFNGLHEKTCSKSDFEDWYARVDEKGEPSCIMGHTQKFRRRKASAKCFVAEKFKDPVPQSEDCKCTDADYECDYENGFVKEDDKCVAPNGIKPKGDDCKGNKKTFVGPSGYRLIPGNTCIKKGGVDKTEPKEHDCDDANKGPVASGKISAEATKFSGESMEFFYLERGSTSSGSDETVIMRTDKPRQVYVSHDHGKKWERILKDEEIVAIYPHQFFNDIVYFITPSKKVWYSKDRCKNIHSFEAPEIPTQDRLQILSFHQTNPDWLIWTGGRDCSGGSCQTIAYVSTKGGDKWEKLLDSVRKCQFVYHEGRDSSDQLVYCEQYENEDKDSPINLYSSSDWFSHKNEVKRDVINFATMAEYIVVAVRDNEQKTLHVHASVDGQSFAAAHFPPNFNVDHQQAYTVLDSSTHAVFLHVTINNNQGQEYGSIIKSNSNGTSYVLSTGEVNRNDAGYVDFEKMQGLEGVAIINRVGNKAKVDEGAEKRLKTWITHNDGAQWSLIPRPEKAPEGKKFDCSGATEKCSLHLHGYTERRDPRDTFSSGSAIGLMIATGNVGEYLGLKKDADTFITRDGGVKWYSAAPGNWMWEFGDQGSIIVLVKEREPTDRIMYSLDEGHSWTSHVFSDTEMEVKDITTLPSDTSRNFLLWAVLRGEIVAVNLDFSGLEERSKKCELNDDDPTDPKNDYTLWEPKHPEEKNNCLFGHTAQYHRKKLKSNCYNGGIEAMQHLHNIVRNCSCSRRDFECDYNYELQSDGSCKLVEGLKAADPKDICKKNPDAIEYYDVTGYRRIPLSTCINGQDLEYTSGSHPCPGKEEDYQKKHGISGVGLFFAIVLPIAAAAGVGYWVWRNWDRGFGRIQLGNDAGGSGVGGSLGLGGSGGGGGHGAFDRDAPWIKYPVMVLSGVVAVVAALPMLAGKIWGTVSTRMGRSRAGGAGYSRPYTSRTSFARGRGDYAVVGPDDEGELLGEDSDEEA